MTDDHAPVPEPPTPPLAWAESEPEDAKVVVEDEDEDLDLGDVPVKRLVVKAQQNADDIETSYQPTDGFEESRDLQFYAVRVASNMEDVIKARLEARIRQSGLDTSFGEVLIPTESVTVIKDGKKRQVQRKKLPGYVIVQMAYVREAAELVRETPGISDFVGASRAGKLEASKPPPMPEEEVEKLKRGDQPEALTPREVKINFESGDPVKIKEGAFESFEGVVGEINAAKGKVTVVVTIFGRPTNVDLEYWQVERVN